MADCILEQIAKKILVALQSIQAAGDPAVVRQRRWGIPDPPKHRQIVLFQREQPERADEPTEAIEWSVEFAALIVISPSESDTTDVMEYANNRAADVQKALMANYQWDGLAINTQIEPYEYHELGIIVPFRVTYRTQYDDPYKQA